VGADAAVADVELTVSEDVWTSSAWMRVRSMRAGTCQPSSPSTGACALTAEWQIREDKGDWMGGAPGTLLYESSSRDDGGEVAACGWPAAVSSDHAGFIRHLLSERMRRPGRHPSTWSWATWRLPCHRHWASWVPPRLHHRGRWDLLSAAKVLGKLGRDGLFDLGVLPVLEVGVLVFDLLLLEYNGTTFATDSSRSEEGIRRGGHYPIRTCLRAANLRENVGGVVGGVVAWPCLGDKEERGRGTNGIVGGGCLEPRAGYVGLRYFLLL
jgi:hypothetical protein